MFCKLCGTKLEKHGTIKEYDENTGEPIYDYRCPKNPCHQWHDWKIYTFKEGTIFWKVYKEKTCKICGFSYPAEIVDKWCWSDVY